MQRRAYQSQHLHSLDESIVVILIAPPPVSLSTFLSKLSAQKTVRTVSSWDLCRSGNTSICESLVLQLSALVQSQCPATYHTLQ